MPKYQDVVDDIRCQMTRGELRPGDRVYSRAEMQARYNVSHATVDKVHQVLAQQGLVTREQGRGTFVAEPAPRRRTGIIGCVGFERMDDETPSYYVRLMRGLQDAAAAAGYELLWLGPNSPAVGNRTVDGIVTCESPLDHGAVARNYEVPAVCFLFPFKGAHNVVADDYQGVRLAVEHLVSLGHRRIAYLFEKDYLAPRRLNGYRAALRAAGIRRQAGWARPLTLHSPDEFRGRGRDTMHRWLQEDWHQLGCTALLAQNDRTALGVYEVLRAAGISVPHDVSVVGFDSTTECQYLTPALTSVCVPLEAMAAAAVTRLLNLLETPSLPPATQKLALTLDVRASTAPPVSGV